MIGKVLAIIKKEEGNAMKILLRLMLVFMLMFVAAPAYAGEAMQIWRCEMDDDTSEDEVKAMAQACGLGDVLYKLY